jgi:hypothetical protein
MNTEQKRQDLAACAALNVMLGGQPSSKSKELMREYGYWDGDKVTEAGATAAGDAMGFQDGAQ